MLSEIWVSIKGYENLYSVSNFGNIRSERNYRDRTWKGKILAQRINECGYKIVGLQHGIGRKGKHFRVHRLVAQAFIGELIKGIDVNHIDGNKTNNILTNLEFCTRSENMRHAVKIGLQPIGEKHPMRIRKLNKKLSENLI